MHRALKLQPHHHTGRLIHHRHTSYSALFGIMIIAGFLMFMTGRIATADDLLVSATVPAPIPSGAPVFTAPESGTTVTAPDVVFEGTCPIIDPGVIIVLYEGQTALGSGPCLGDGSFSVTVTLTPGVHSSVATVMTITGDTGDSSPPISITYTPPPAPSVTPSTPSSPASPQNPKTSRPAPRPLPLSAADLTIITTTPFVSFGVNHPSHWTAQFAGGRAPYAITIDWGDGEKTVRDAMGADLQDFTHTYHHDQNYTFTVTLSDTANNQLTRRFAAVPVGNGHAPVIPPNPVITALDGMPNDPTSTLIDLYLGLLLAIVIMWRYEYIHYRHAVGLPTHYHWQLLSGKKKHHHG